MAATDPTAATGFSGTAPGLDRLPDRVRAKVVALVAPVLPQTTGLPPALRRIASFAPARRAKVGAGAVLAALEGSGGDVEALRERIASQVCLAAGPDRAVGEPGPSAAGATATGAAAPRDAAEQAALAWLVRPEGWLEDLADALDRLEEEQAAQANDPGEVERLRAKLATAEQQLRETRAARKARVDELKEENASLRRKLGQARAAARETQSEDAGELERERVARQRAEEEAARAARERDRLRDQVERLEAAVAAQRRTSRVERDEASVRARVLLDTIIDAAAGLRRELALPPVTGAPGDRVEAALDAPDPAASAGTAGTLRSASHLDTYLQMPRARMIVDGYNVSKTLWPSSSLEAQRLRLLRAIAPLVARSGAETTVVFDAAASSVRPVVAAPRGVKVLFSPEGVIADDVIRDLVAAEPVGRVVMVVSDDREVVTDATRAGARAVPVGVLAERLERAG